MKRLIYLAILFRLILSGCQKEPTIRLIEERQAALSIERIEEQENESLEDTNNSLMFEPKTFIAYDDDYLFEDISDFIPIQANQVNVFDENGVITQQYLDYMDSNAKILQVREVAQEGTMNIYYT